jgi:tetratricopeptide (TPR) repeat protein
MPLRILKITILFIVSALILAFANTNSTPASISIGAGNTLSASVGILVLSAFAFGVLLALIGASLYAARSYFRERSMKSTLAKKELLQKELIQAQQLQRSTSSLHVQKKYRQLIQKNSDSLLLRIEFIRALIAANDFSLALNEITAAKKIEEAEELFFLAACCYEKLGNKVAELESLVMSLSHFPQSIATLEKASQLSFELGRFDDCLVYLDSLADLQKPSIQHQRLSIDAQASIIIRDTTDETSRAEKLLTLVMRHDNSAVALKELARIKQKEGQFDESAQCLVRLFRITHEIAHMKNAISLWLKNGKSQEALSALHTWQRMSEVSQKSLVSIEIAKAHMLLGQDHEAFDVLDDLDKSGSLPELQKKEVAILRALLALRRRDSTGTALAITEIEKISLRAGNEKF